MPEELAIIVTHIQIHKYTLTKLLGKWSEIKIGVNAWWLGFYELVRGFKQEILLVREELLVVVDSDALVENGREVAQNQLGIDEQDV